jgi:UDP-glucose 4-epimerase
MKRILVTGGTGYIGSHTSVALVEAGYEVVLLDNFTNSYPWIAERIGQITGKEIETASVDISARIELERFIHGQPPFHGVIHFAALKAVGDSVKHPLRYYRNNVIGMINLLEVMMRYDVAALVFSSSCTVYGSPEKIPVDESAPLQPALSPYGNTKRMCEEIMADQVKTGHLKGIALRYFNPVGAHPSGLIGELPIGLPDNLMPYITQTAIGKRPVLRVFGNDYPTPDGTAIRDYIHITDLAEAHVKAVGRIMNDAQKQPMEYFNLGTGNGYSVLEMIHAFEKATGVALPWEFAPRRPGDITEIWADASLANRELGWKAKLGLHEMVSSAWNWERQLKVESRK